MKNYKQEILGALARGYTYPENSHKVLDSDLINAMYDELAPIVDEMKEKAWMYDGLNK